MLGGGKLKSIYELSGEGQSIRSISRNLSISRNTVRKYLRSPGIPQAKPRPKRPSKLDPYKEHLQQRLSEGVDNGVVLLDEIREQGYTGGYTILKDYLQPYRRTAPPKATVRFETEPGEQAQVDFGLFKYKTPDGKTKRVWGFSMVLSWSRAMYVEFVNRADVSTFIKCHINAFSHLGGIPRNCLYDNTKAVVLGRDESGVIWNQKFLDFSLRMGFNTRLCRPYRPRTKGRVESSIKYIRRNFWPRARFMDLNDLNRQAQSWRESIANVRIHGTTHERPIDRLLKELESLSPMPAMDRVTPFLREERIVGRDGFVQWERSWYGVSWKWASQKVQVQRKNDVVEIWAGDQRLAIHPCATKPGQRFPIPGQWQGLKEASDFPRKEPLAVQLPYVEVEKRSLEVYGHLLEGAHDQ